MTQDKINLPHEIYAINNYEHPRKWYALNLAGSEKYIRADIHQAELLAAQRAIVDLANEYPGYSAAKHADTITKAREAIK